MKIDLNEPFVQSVANALSYIDSFSTGRNTGTKVTARFGENKTPWWIYASESKVVDDLNRSVLNGLADVMKLDGLSFSDDHRTITFNRAVVDFTFNSKSIPACTTSDLFALYGLAKGLKIQPCAQSSALLDAYREASKANSKSAVITCTHTSDPGDINDHNGPLLAAVPKGWFGTSCYSFDLAEGGISGVDAPIIGEWLSFEPQFSAGLLNLCLSILHEDEGFVWAKMSDFFEKQRKASDQIFGRLFPSQWGTANCGIIFVPNITTKRSAVAIATLMSMGFFCYGLAATDYSLVSALKSFGVTPLTFVKVGSKFGALRLLPYVASLNAFRFIDIVATNLHLKPTGSTPLDSAWDEGFDTFAFKAPLFSASDLGQKAAGMLIAYCWFNGFNSQGAIRSENSPAFIITVNGEEFANLDHGEFADIFDAADVMWEERNG